MSMGGADEGLTKFKKEQSKLAGQTQDKLFDIADQLANLSDSFFTEYVQPILTQLGDNVGTAIQNFDDIYQSTQNMIDTRENIFQTEGVAGLKAFMDRALGFNEQEYAAREGALAVGDISNQEAIAKETMQRQLAARGVNATSGAALAGLQGVGINASLAKAAAWTQARRAAEARGDQFASAAGQMGIQMSGLPAPYLGTNMAAAGAGVDATNAQLQGTQFGWNTKVSGLQAAGSILSPMHQQASANTANAVTNIANQNSQNMAGLGKLAGTAAGVGLSLFPGTQAAGLALLGAQAKTA